jgi:hypothetical protein
MDGHELGWEAAVPISGFIRSSPGLVNLFGLLSYIHPKPFGNDDAIHFEGLPMNGGR